MRNFLGKNDFTWFFGVVEDRNDPVQLGRVRVRCYGWHTDDKDKIPTEHLPWAQVIQNVTSAAVSGKGTSPTGLVEGSWVIGFFLDGSRAQEPVVMGSLAGIPENLADTTLGFNDPNGVYPLYTNESDVNKLSRGTNSITKTPDSITGEPASPYAAQYPKNHVYESESGHVVEIDDTANAERIHIYHKSGTFIEMHPNGDVVTHHKNGFRTVTGNDKLHVTGDMDIYVDGNVNWNVTGDVTENIEGNMDTNVTKNITTDGKTINLNSGVNGAARIGDTADTGDAGTGSHFDVNQAGTNIIESGSATVFIGD